MNQPFVWAEIDLAAIAHNIRELRRITRPQAELMVAVKANGYGHGATAVARTALANGANQLGVARIEEGIELRRAGIDAPILVFGYTPAHLVPEMIAHDLMASVFSLESARAMHAAVPGNATLVIHPKVDTGMGRLGLLPDAQRCRLDGAAEGLGAIDEVAGIANLDRLRLDGLWTHYASSDEKDKTYTRMQLEAFNGFARQVEERGISIRCRHSANSGAIIDLPETHMDMVRAGISVYGLYPSQDVNQGRIDLQPAMTLKARIVHLKTVPAGTRISYGGTWQAPKDTAIATIPVGYGDGYSRGLSNRGEMLVNGQRAPIVGRVCMDLTMIDVGHIASVAIGDEVVLIGRQGEATISAEAVAAAVDTINYEVTTSLTSRVPRVFLDASKR
jgi:alanine racemase